MCPFQLDVINFLLRPLDAVYLLPVEITNPDKIFYLRRVPITRSESFKRFTHKSKHNRDVYIES